MCNISVKTILNEIHPIKGFVYKSVEMDSLAPRTLRVLVEARKNSQGICSGCGNPDSCYDHCPEREWAFIPLWGIRVVLVCALRRIACKTCGARVEKVPWATGKYQICDVFRLFLAQWARHMSWAEVARIFHVSWADVYVAVKWVVDYGLQHRDLTGVRALGVDEIYVGAKEKFWTLVYQIDGHSKRLLWIGRDRTQATIESFFVTFGPEFCSGIHFICSDMWKPYLNAAAKYLPTALSILDRFHIVKKLNAAIDEIRREEVRARIVAGLEPLLKKMRWVFLKKRKNWTPTQRRRMREIEGSTLRTLHAFLLVEAFQHFWTYRSSRWAGKFLDLWCSKVAQSRLEPLKKVARTLEAHRSLLMNYFEAAKKYSSGVVEGLNAKVKLTLRRSYGFRTANARELALYHNLAKLPEPRFTHSFV